MSNTRGWSRRGWRLGRSQRLALIRRLNRCVGVWSRLPLLRLLYRGRCVVVDLVRLLSRQLGRGLQV
ncbi:MAG TPA: hypothetical protein EYP33_03055 [Pyrodictium sp.]|nr:hypothetical protein [Pyrodictium sp.]